MFLNLYTKLELYNVKFDFGFSKGGYVHQEFVYLWTLLRI